MDRKHSVPCARRHARSVPEDHIHTRRRRCDPASVGSIHVNAQSATCITGSLRQGSLALSCHDSHSRGEFEDHVLQVAQRLNAYCESAQSTGKPSPAPLTTAITKPTPVVSPSEAEHQNGLQQQSVCCSVEPLLLVTFYGTAPFFAPDQGVSVSNVCSLSHSDCCRFGKKTSSPLASQPAESVLQSTYAHPV